MMMYMLVVFFTGSLALLLSGLMFFLSLAGKKFLTKMSPFECGFLSYEESRSPFSIHFFLVGLIFLIFDIELILIFPYTTSELSGFSILSLLLLVMFILILTLGLLVEWEKSMLDWQN